MHQTGIVSFLIYPMYLLFSKNSVYSLVRRFFIYLASFACVVFIFAFSDSFLAALSGVKDSYSYMVTNKGKGGLLITPLIYLGFISLLHFMDSKISGIVYNSRQSYSKEIVLSSIFVSLVLCWQNCKLSHWELAVLDIISSFLYLYLSLTDLRKKIFS